MRKTRIALLAVLTIPLLALIPSGCGEDEAAPPPPAVCPAEVTTPQDSTRFFSGDDVHVRWAPTGPGTVAVRLLREGQFLGSIVENWPNNGYVYWEAGTMGQTSSDDFALVLFVDGGACADTVPIQLVNTLGCVIQITDSPPAELNAGDDLEINWVSENTSGQLDVELWRRNAGEDRLIAEIDLGINDNGSYLWENVDSFNEGTHNDYYLRFADAMVQGCVADWGPIRIVDTEICIIDVTAPQADEVFTVGQETTLRFNAFNSTGQVNIFLYAGGQLVPGGYIAEDVDAASGEYVWTVDDFGFDEANNLYRIVVVDALDRYCFGRSGTFTINKNQ